MGNDFTATGKDKNPGNQRGPLSAADREKVKQIADAFKENLAKERAEKKRQEVLAAQEEAKAFEERKDRFRTGLMSYVRPKDFYMGDGSIEKVYSARNIETFNKLSPKLQKAMMDYADSIFTPEKRPIKDYKQYDNDHKSAHYSANNATMSYVSDTIIAAVDAGIYSPDSREEYIIKRLEERGAELKKANEKLHSKDKGWSR